jgi:arsenate reductase
MPIRVLFLCSGNTARSQMAEAFLRKYGGKKFIAYSAGTKPVDIHPMTYQVMEEVGISLANHRSKGFREYMGRVHFGYLITVCESADKNCPTVFPGVGARMHWPFEDPAAFEGNKNEKLNKFREIRDAIEERIMDWIKEKGK